MIYREWKLRRADAEKTGALANWLQGRGRGGARLLAGVLAARGFDTPETAEALLQTPPLPNPLCIKDMDRAVRRIRAAIQNEESIAVFGDYDVDGITATALLYLYLEAQGAAVFYKIPSRNDDDYGLSPAQVDGMADKGISLIVTVDNGTTAFEAAQRAKERGVSLVITDHHLPYDTLPPAEALVNPHRADDESGLGGLSGAGVAFMLLAALEDCPAEELLPLFGDLAAIGTVADVMRLLGPNRSIVSGGLAVLQEARRPGLAALIADCGKAGKELTAENISYGIAPRLNAAGRMDHAAGALRLLLTEDEDEAAALVQSLSQQNAARQKAEGEILEAIERQIEEDDALRRGRVLVIWGEGWHQGVIGIVASRLVDKYAKPAVVISVENGEGKGSGRSVGGFSLYDAIAACAELLIRYGGHSLAAGFSLKSENLPDFRRRLNEWAARHAPAPAPPDIWADAAVALPGLTLAEVQALELLAPCGTGNPPPQFLVRDAVIDAVYPVSEGRHSRLRLTQNGGALCAILFGQGPQALPYKAGERVDALVCLSVYRGKAEPQISARILEMRPAGMGNTHAAQSVLFERFCAGGAVTGMQSEDFTPSRGETAAVYRLVRDAGGLCASDLRPLFAKLGEERAGRVMCALAVLEEMGVVERDAAGGTLRAAEVRGKRDLEQSSLLRRLRQVGGLAGK